MTKTFNEAIGNLALLKSLLDDCEFDAIVAGTPENVRYVADVMISTQYAIRDRLAFVVWAKGRDPIFVLCQVEEGYVRQQSWISDIRGYKEFVTRPMDVLADVLAELG
ncbi:MAG: hypothetical protein KDJ77_19925, partial [Rhodobiaceae bacterium]|nr:hypothetical protein [Rhodobiaceae bacterium]